MAFGEAFTGSDEPIQRQKKPQSRQPRFRDKQEALFYWIDVLEKWSKEAIITVPSYSPDSRKLDAWLREFWKQEPLLSGVLSSVISIDKNRAWTMTGGRNQVRRFTDVLRFPNPVYVKKKRINASTWRYFSSQQSESYWTSNMGAVTELGSDVPGGRLADLWHVDSARCRLTGNVLDPLMYTPSRGKEQQWPAGSFFRTVSMPSTDERFHGVGYCATMRAVQLAIIMVAVYRHDKESLYAAMQKGILLLRGIDDQQWVTAMEVHAEQLTRRERQYFGGVSILFGDETLDGKMLSLSSLPENFNLTEFSNVLMQGYSLCFGFDINEFWSIAASAFGRGKESEIQAVKSTSKGALDFSHSYQDNLQQQLPATVLFQFEQRNEAGKQLEAQVMESFAKSVNAMSASPVPGFETLTREERRYLYAERGLIPEDWTLPEEPETTSDTDAIRERLLSFDQVRRACEAYAREPIVQYVWPLGITRTLWSSGESALHRRSYPALKKKRQLEDPKLETPIDDQEESEEVAAFIVALTALNQQALDGEITQAAYEEELNDLILAVGLSVFLVASGQESSELSSEQMEQLQEYFDVNANSIPGLAENVYDGTYDENEGGLTSRLLLWVISLVALGTFAAITGHSEENFRFELGGTIEHCTDCLRLDGQIHTGQEWLDSGLYPQSPNLECKGFYCDCRIVPTDEDVRGSF